MVRYFSSFAAGLVIGFAFLAALSCVDKKTAAEAADAGAPVPLVEGSMTVGTPTLTVVESTPVDGGESVVEKVVVDN
jgi:hypothetical protein